MLVEEWGLDQVVLYTKGNRGRSSKTRCSTMRGDPHGRDQREEGA